MLACIFSIQRNLYKEDTSNSYFDGRFPKLFPQSKTLVSIHGTWGHIRSTNTVGHLLRSGFTNISMLLPSIVIPTPTCPYPTWQKDRWKPCRSSSTHFSYTQGLGWSNIMEGQIWRVSMEIIPQNSLFHKKKKREFGIYFGFGKM